MNATDAASLLDAARIAARMADVVLDKAETIANSDVYCSS
jgi:hypothetical protein